MSKKAVSDQMDAANTMVSVRDLGGSATGGLSASVLPGQLILDSEADAGRNIRVVSKYHVVAAPTARYLSIPKKALAEVASFSSSAVVNELLNSLLTKISSQSHWLETQHSMAGSSESAVATGNKLWDQQAKFLKCDRCSQKNCHSLKPACITRQKKLIAAQSSVRTEQPLSGYNRLRAFDTTDGMPHVIDESKFDEKGNYDWGLDSRRISEAELNSNAKELEKKKRSAGRRGSIETLFGMFRRGKDDDDSKNNKKIRKKAGQRDGNSVSDRIIEKQQTIKALSKEKTDKKNEEEGKKKGGRRGSLSSMAKNLFSMFD
jgi:hypothetical protein